MEYRKKLNAANKRNSRAALFDDSYKRSRWHEIMFLSLEIMKLIKFRCSYQDVEEHKSIGKDTSLERSDFTYTKKVYFLIRTSQPDESFDDKVGR